MVRVTPGVGDVPRLPKGANGSFESFERDGEGDDGERETVIVGTEVVTRKKASFEWPEDVF